MTSRLPYSKGSADDPFDIGPNAPISLVKAAKASLKDPTRPVTPADNGRHLLMEGQNRPATAMYVPNPSKFFYSDGGPKLALPELKTSRPDPRSILNLSPAVSAGSSPTGMRRTSSHDMREQSRLGDHSVASSSGGSSFTGGAGKNGRSGPWAEESSTSQTGMQRPLWASIPRNTAAADIAKLKAELAAAEAEGRGSSAAASLEMRWLNADADLRDMCVSTPEEIEQHIVALAAGPVPGRNDDLPARPSTSRGRPSSALDSDPIHITDRFDGPPPGMVDYGNGAQVLDISHFQQYKYSDEEEDDDYNTAEHDSSPPESQPSSSAPSQSHLPRRDTHPPPQSQSQTASATQVMPETVLDPTEAFFTWRRSVEHTLHNLIASVSYATDPATSPSVTDCIEQLGSLVTECRKHPRSSDWLRSSSTVFMNKKGGRMSVREAVCDHMVNLEGDADMNIKAATVALRVAKSLHNLLDSTQLVYKLSKVPTNDVKFREEGLLEVIVTAMQVMLASSSGSSMLQLLMFSTGALKNVTVEPSNQKHLLKLGILHVLATLLNQIAALAEEFPRDRAGCMTVAVQATGVLRNLSVVPNSAPSFLAAGLLPVMCAIGKHLSDQREVVLNLARTLAKLTIEDCCQAAIEQDLDYAPVLVELLGQYAKHRIILLRLAFVLGNLTTHSNEYRQQVAAVPGAIACLVATLELYVVGDGGDAVEREAMQANPNRAAAPSKEECLVKVLRLAANLAIHPDVGPQLACLPVVADALQRVLQRYRFSSSEELVLNCVCALTNLSFYQSYGAFTNQVLEVRPHVLLEHITPLLLCDNEEAVIEAARVYGNYSRSANVRQYMEDKQVVDALVLLLDHSNTELVYSVCGTLINFTMEPARKATLAGLGGVSRLVEVLGRTVEQGELTDMEVGIVLVVCKALFNVCADDNAHSHSTQSCSFSEHDTEAVLLILDHIEGSALADLEDVSMVASRLAGQLRQLQSKLQWETLPAHDNGG